MFLPRDIVRATTGLRRWLVVLALAFGCTASPSDGAGLCPDDPAGCDPVDLGGSDSDGCFAIPNVDRVRVYPREGYAEALIGGQIEGSRVGPTNGFRSLFTIEAVPPEGQWTEYILDNEETYRYVKYAGPSGSSSTIAEIEFYSGSQKVTGEVYGSHAPVHVPANGFDGNTSTFYEGADLKNSYLGLDLAAGHVVSIPELVPAPGRFASKPTITLSTQTPNATIYYTTDGTDPSERGIEYRDPIALALGSTVITAIAVADCMVDSETASGTYRVGSSNPSGTLTTLFIGNSLTDTIDTTLPPLASSGGILLDYQKKTIPGAGTSYLFQNPSAGFGVPNLIDALKQVQYDQISFQPFPNMPCRPVSTVPAAEDWPDAMARSASDSWNIHSAWKYAKRINPDVQIWVYQQWPDYDDYQNCMSSPALWQKAWSIPKWPPPTNWEEAVQNELRYHEAVRDELEALNPDDPEPYVVPGGLALLKLKEEIEAGNIPGMTSFPEVFFRMSATGWDLHATENGRYFIALVFYACLFQTSPLGLPNSGGASLTDAQRAAFQRIVWEVVNDYPFSGLKR